MTIIEHKGQKWRDDGFAYWYFSYSGDMYEGMILAVKAFENIFIPEKFSYDPFGSGIYNRKNTPWFDIKNIDEIKRYLDPSKKVCYLFGRMKIIKQTGEEKWIEGIRFHASKCPPSEGYNEVSIGIETDDWLREYTNVKSHETFNKYLEKMKEALRGKIIDYEGYEGIANKNGFDLEKVKEVREKYGK